MENNNLGAAYFSIFVAMVLTVVPIPESYVMWRPAWVPLLVIYWVATTPHKIGVFTAWCVGLLLDDLEGGVLGQNALALSFVAFFTYALHTRMRVFPVWQQIVTVMVLVGVYQLVNITVERAVSLAAWKMSYWLPSITAGLVWPLVAMLLGQSRHRNLMD